jgi:hypothetical protein
MIPASATCALGVGDDEVGRIELPEVAVECPQLLSGARAAHDHRATRQRLEVEDVQRASEHEHHVVGDVDDVRDRADAGPHPQPRLEP